MVPPRQIQLRADGMHAPLDPFNAQFAGPYHTLDGDWARWGTTPHQAENIAKEILKRVYA